jgi:hypothetical protein
VRASARAADIAPTIAELQAAGATSLRQIAAGLNALDWKRYGNAAGPIRNQRMLEWGPDLVVAFAGGTGTAGMVALARAAGVPVIEP